MTVRATAATSGLRSRLRTEQGFSLVEVMSIMIILTILAGIALATYLGLRSRFQDRSAMAELRSAEQFAKQAMVQLSALPPEPELIDGMTAEGRGLKLTIGSDRLRAGGVVSVMGRTTPVPTITFTTRSASGTCFFLRLDPAGAVDRHTEEPGVDATGEYCAGAMFDTTEVPAGW